MNNNTIANIKQAPQIRQSIMMQIVLITLLAIVNITPSLSRSLDPKVSFGFFVLWMLLAIATSGISTVFRDKNNVALWWGVLVVWQIALSAIGFSSRVPNFFIQRASVYMLPVIGVYSTRFFNKRELNLLFFLIFCVLAYNLIDNLILTGGSSSYFENYGYNDEEFLNSNIGKTTFVSTMMYLSGLMVFLYLLSHKYTYRTIGIFVAILAAFYVVFVNSRTTATMLLLMMVFGLIYFNRGKNALKPRRLISFFVLMIAGLILLRPVFDILISFLPDRSAERLSSISDVFNGQINLNDFDKEDSFSVRIFLAGVSIKTWLSGPVVFLFGRGEDAASGGSIYELVDLGIGQHSQIIDYLAMYGIFGLFLLIKALHATFMFIKETCSDLRRESMVKVFLLVFIIESVLNNTLFAGQLFVLTLMLPYLNVLLERKLVVNKM